MKQVTAVAYLCAALLGCGGPKEPPPPPDGFVATLTATGVHLTWSKVDVADAYMIDRRQAGAMWQTITHVDSKTFEYQDDGLVAGMAYGYRIMWMSKSEHGPWSNEITIVMP